MNHSETSSEESAVAGTLGQIIMRLQHRSSKWWLWVEYT